MNSLKVLFIGNSFSEDTVTLAPYISKALGIENIFFANLYIGGCSIRMHHEHITEDSPLYTYRINEGEEWISSPEYKISDAIKSQNWDYIIIQHGTNDKSRYTSPESYDMLTPLVKKIKEIATPETKIGFNLTWMGESTRQHHEIISYDGDIGAMRSKLEEVTEEVICKNPLIDLLIPTGTAIENARTSKIGLLTRDCYHLSMDKGRYIAALTFIAKVSGECIDNISWAPAKVDAYAKAVAIESAKNALASPLKITRSNLI